MPSYYESVARKGILCFSIAPVKCRCADTNRAVRLPSKLFCEVDEVEECGDCLHLGDVG